MLGLLALAALLTPVPVQDSLTLQSALSRARALRGQVRIAAARVAGARGELRVAGTIENPIAVYSHTQDTPRQHLSFEQSFDWLFRRGADRASARAALTGAVADSVQVMAQLSAEVTRAFYGALAAGRALDLARDQSRLADSLAALAERRLARGDIAEFERDQVALEAARVGQLVSRVREAERTAVAELARQIAWTPGDPAPSLAGTLDAGLEDLPPALLASDSLPRVRLAVADSIAAAWRLTSLRRSQLPLPSITAGADWDDPTQPGSGALSVIGVSIPLPLWNHRGGEVAVAEADARQAGGAAMEVRLEARQRLAAARARLEEGAIRARTARDRLLPAATRLRERATAAYRAGDTGVLPVLDALRAEREVTAGSIEDLLAFQDAMADWYSLVGVVP